jgi:hypothetical protein
MSNASRPSKSWRRSIIAAFENFKNVLELSHVPLSEEEERRILEEEEAEEKKRLAAEVEVSLNSVQLLQDSGSKSMFDPSLPDPEVFQEASVIVENSIPPATTVNYISVEEVGKEESLVDNHVINAISADYQASSYIPDYEEVCMLAEEEAEEKKRLQAEIEAAFSAPRISTPTRTNKRPSVLRKLLTTMTGSVDNQGQSSAINELTEVDVAERRSSFPHILSTDDENYIADDGDEVNEEALLAEEEMEEKQRIALQLESFETKNNPSYRRGSVFRALSGLGWGIMQEHRKAKDTKEEEKDAALEERIQEDLLNKTVDWLESDFDRREAEEEQTRLREFEQSVLEDEKMRLASDDIELTYDVYNTP